MFAPEHASTDSTLAAHPNQTQQKRAIGERDKVSFLSPRKVIRVSLARVTEGRSYKILERIALLEIPLIEATQDTEGGRMVKPRHPHLL